MPNAGGTANLADLIMAKIQEREARDKSAADGMLGFRTRRPKNLCPILY